MQPNSRFLVPDLSPKDRSALKANRPRMIFVGESPHVSEVEPEKLGERRPLCGAAGRQWWSLLSEVLEGKPNQEVTLSHLLGFCERHRLAVMNAVQYPLDPKVARVFPDADPVKNLGFNKVSGPASFKRMKKTDPMKRAIESLAERLNHPSVAGIPIYPLGNDALWFVEQALLLAEGDASRLGGKIPHPSAWWRQGGWFGRLARERLDEIFAPAHLTLGKASKKAELKKRV